MIKTIHLYLSFPISISILQIIENSLKFISPCFNKILKSLINEEKIFFRITMKKKNDITHRLPRVIYLCPEKCKFLSNARFCCEY